MKLAVIGTGISGLVVAYLLRKRFELTVYESNGYAGGHTNTVRLNRSYGDYDIDTGFIVYNSRTYPNFLRLLNQLDVGWQKTKMGFSVRDEKADFEYSSESLAKFFAQKKNLLRGDAYRLVWDILRFNRQSGNLLRNNGDCTPLLDYLITERYSQVFINHFIIPMGAAIWSTNVKQMRSIPAHFFVRFFQNHGILNITDRIIWRVIKKGSFRYVKKIVNHLRGKIRLNTPVNSISRRRNAVQVVCSEGIATYDHVVIATHSDQALKLLNDASEEEQKILGAIPYQKNTAILHTDESIMPKKKQAWSSWNFSITPNSEEQVCISYNMNKLQSLKAEETFIVTLNSDMINPKKIIKQFEYEHPLFTQDAVKAQKKHDLINGKNRTWFCGAYWRYGFHEDGVVSALRVCKHFGVGLDDA